MTIGVGCFNLQIWKRLQSCLLHSRYLGHDLDRLGGLSRESYYKGFGGAAEREDIHYSGARQWSPALNSRSKCSVG